MDLALKTAQNAGKSGEVPIGCVIVRDYEVIATAGNRTPIDRDPTAHAGGDRFRAIPIELFPWGTTLSALSKCEAHRKRGHSGDKCLVGAAHAAG